MEKLVQEKKKRIADQEKPKSIPKLKIHLSSSSSSMTSTSSSKSSSTSKSSSIATESDVESVKVVMSKDVKGKQNVSLCVNCEIVFIAPYY